MVHFAMRTCLTRGKASNLGALYFQHPAPSLSVTFRLLPIPPIIACLAAQHAKFKSMTSSVVGSPGGQSVTFHLYASNPIKPVLSVITTFATFPPQTTHFPVHGLPMAFHTASSSDLLRCELSLAILRWEDVFLLVFCPLW